MTKPTILYKAMNCGNCNTAVSGNFCSDCGRPRQITRIDWHYIVHEIMHVLHFEKGILHTIRELLLKPGTSIQTFITSDRSRLVKPVLFIVVTSLIYTTIEHLFHIEKGYVNYTAINHSAVSVIFAWVQSHYGYANIIQGIFIAFWLKLAFRRQGYNFFEILILLCFVMGMGMLILSVFAMVEGLTGIHTMGISAVVGLCYSCWAIGNFLGKRSVISYLKVVAFYVLGMLTCVISVIMVGVLIDLIKR
jgi:hypothetical protein